MAAGRASQGRNNADNDLYLWMRRSRTGAGAPNAARGQCRACHSNFHADSTQLYYAATQGAGEYTLLVARP